MSNLAFSIQDLLYMFQGVMNMVIEIRLKDDQVKIWHFAAEPEAEGIVSDYHIFWDKYLEKYIFDEERQACKDALSLEKIYQAVDAGEKHWRFNIRFTDDRLGIEWHEITFCVVDAASVLLMSRRVNAVRKMEIIDTIMRDEYEYVIYLDIKKNSFVMYDIRTEKGTIVPSDFGDDYEREMISFNRQYVVADECETLIEKMRIRSILTELAEHNEYVIYCTAMENGVRRDKKLRFSYLNKMEKIILLTRIDITEVRERERENQHLALRLKEEIVKSQEKTLSYFEDMPIAFSIIRVDVDEFGEPYDFVFDYLNEAHAKLEGIEKERILHKSFYQLFANADKKWLKIYYKTAYQGLKQQLTEYSPEIERYLEISTYQSGEGYCGCILRDVTASLMLEIELEQQREREILLLKNTTDAIFQYDMEEKVIYIQLELVEKYNAMPKITDIPYGLLRNGLILPEGIKPIQEAIDALEKGKKTSSCEVMARLTEEDQFYWHNIFFSSYIESHTEKRRAIGFLKNINATVLQRKWLEKAASLDGLTGLFNLATAKSMIEDFLLTHTGSEKEKNAFFMFDLDDFKEVNDNHGHAFGDLVLRQFAEILKKAFHRDQIVFRHGGDEFGAFVMRISDKAAVERICENIFDELKQLAKTGMSISVSIGVFISSSMHAYELFYKAADKQLYKVKGSGKHSFMVGEDDEDDTGRK